MIVMRNIEDFRALPLDHNHRTTMKDSLTIQSNLIPTNDLHLGGFRLLEVDQRLVLPRRTHIRFLVTSTDVLHS